ncbi:MAG: hypothetical protein JXR91_03130 [Deltaproteobacteria bacterium]|nr:hypothetical protein [Deltaproteobacteria bacterium]
MIKTTFYRLFSIFSYLLLFTSCTAANQNLSAWNPDEAQFFDDSIDIIEDYNNLSGQWEFDAKEEFNGRSNLADIIAIVNITSIQTSQDNSGKEEKRIEMLVTKFIYGTLESNDIVLATNAESKSYTLIMRYEKNLKGEHLLFLRRFKTSEGYGEHFHISPASDKLKNSVRELVEKRIEAESKPIN